MNKKIHSIIVAIKKCIIALVLLAIIYIILFFLHFEDLKDKERNIQSLSREIEILSQTKYSFKEEMIDIIDSYKEYESLYFKNIISSDDKNINNGTFIEDNVYNDISRYPKSGLSDLEVQYIKSIDEYNRDISKKIIEYNREVINYNYHKDSIIDKLFIYDFKEYPLR